MTKMWGALEWARGILQRCPQPSCGQADIVSAAPVSVWINATKFISVMGMSADMGELELAQKLFDVFSLRTPSLLASVARTR